MPHRECILQLSTIIFLMLNLFHTCVFCPWSCCKDEELLKKTGQPARQWGLCSHLRCSVQFFIVLRTQNLCLNSFPCISAMCFQLSSYQGIHQSVSVFSSHTICAHQKIRQSPNAPCWLPTGLLREGLCHPTSGFSNLSWGLISLFCHHDCMA